MLAEHLFSSLLGPNNSLCHRQQPRAGRHADDCPASRCSPRPQPLFPLPASMFALQERPFAVLLSISSSFAIRMETFMLENNGISHLFSFFLVGGGDAQKFYKSSLLLVSLVHLC